MMISGKIKQFMISRAPGAGLVLLALFLAQPLSAAGEWQFNKEELQAAEWEYLEGISHDGLHYTAVLEKGQRSDDLPFLRVFRLSEEDGSTAEIWRYEPASNIRISAADFCVSDLDRDNMPELVLIYDIEVEKEPEWLRIFEWQGSTFSSRPVSSSRLLVDRTVKNRPRRILYGTFEAGKGSQLGVLYGGSQRRFYTFTMEGALNTAIWRQDKEFVSPRFLDGSTELEVLPFRLNAGEANRVLFYTGNNAATEFSLISLDSDGQSRELAYLKTESENAGNLRSISRAGKHEGSSKLFFSTDRKALAMISYGKAGGLQMKGLPIDHDFAPETVLERIVRSRGEFLVLAYDNTPSFNIYHLGTEGWNIFKSTRSRYSGKRRYAKAVSDTDSSSIFIITEGPRQYFLEALDLPLRDEEETVEPSEGESVAEDLTLPGVEGPEDPPPADEENLLEELTYKISQYDYVHVPGDTFKQNVELGSIDPGELQISWEAPEGATFNIKTGDISWKIAEEQLDRQSFDLKIGNHGDTSAYYWTIYVNHIPELMNSQNSFIIGLHQPFSLQLDVLDKNSDAELTYILQDLAGGRISNDGLIEWNPGENALDINIFSVLISDGFTVVEEKFMIYVNDPVHIISRPKSHILPLDEEWQYVLDTEDRNEEFLFQIAFGTEALLDSYTSAIERFMLADKVSVEREARERVFADVRQNVKAVQRFENKLFITFHQYDERIKFTEYLSGILDIGYKNIPQYAVRQIKQLHYKMTEHPERMELKKWGQISWTPGKDELNSHILEIEASDVISTDRQFLNLYVNASPVITSAPRAVVLNPGQLLTYKCQVEDLNADARISYRLSDDSPPADLDQDGQLVWRVKPGQFDYEQLKIIVDDGYTEDEVKLMMYVNDPVKFIPFEPIPAQVEKLWKHELKYKDRNKSSLYRVVVEDINVFREIEERMRLFLNRQKVPVIRPEGNDGKGREIDARPAVKNLFAYGVNLFIEIDPDYKGKAELTDIFAGILERSINYLPKHKKFHDKNIKFRALSAPQGMEVSEEGKMAWVPKAGQIDTFNLLLEVSDAISADTLDLKIFSNSPPSVVSTPPEIVHIGDKWVYPIEINDLNKNQPYEITIIEAPEGLILKKSTLYWKPELRQKGSNTISFIVSDGHQNTAQTFNVFANAAPVINSKPVIVGLTGFDYSYQIDAEDPNGDEIRFRAVDIPKFASVDEKTGLVEWEPRSGERGINRFVIEIKDARNKTIQHTFDVQVYEDPAAKKFSLAVFPVMVTVVGVILMAALL